MEKLIILGEEMQNIYKMNDNYLLKYSSLPIKAWSELIDKKIDYINTPIIYSELTLEEQVFHPYKESLIILPFLKNAKSLLEVNKIVGYDTSDVLKLLKLNLHFLTSLHKNDVYHGDINEMNIMLDDNLQPIFIDFDAAVINDNISNENIYTYVKNDVATLKELYASDDKRDLLMIYLSYLAYGKFNIRTNYYFPIKKLCLPSSVEKEINAYINKDLKINKEYYFEDIINFLLASDYEAKSLKKQKH